jgi:glycosyltransferase involved in cell wall biosynthesis
VTEPLVSILIPTYNGERFLRPALRSALTQSHRNLEVLVGDDASTDRTAEILAAIAAEDPRVRVIRRETNLGAYENPRQLLAEARGEYVKFLLHDDVLATECVRTLVRGMESAPGVTLAFSRRSLINEDGRPVPGHEFPALSDRPGILPGRELGDTALEACTNTIGEATTILFRRTDVDPEGLWQTDGRRMDVLNDLKLSLELLARGDAFYTPSILSRFRVHATQNGQNSGFLAQGTRSWPKLIDWGVRQGFLADENRRRKAYVLSLVVNANWARTLIDGPHYGPSLEGVLLATAALLELGPHGSRDDVRPLVYRAHEPAALGRFAQELDVWTQSFPIALAAPVVDAHEVTATVQALREVQAAGIAEKFVVAVPDGRLEEATRLLETALAAGSDLDLELVPAEDPATLFRGPWLAVATRDSSWHDGHAAAVWAVPAIPR